MIALPHLAERLLRWSLPEDDREAVLGDLHEEFVALADAAGAAHARRWYWQQTVLSLGPNLARRLRTVSESHRLETEAVRQSRLRARKVGLACLVIGAPLLFFENEPLAVASFVFIISGVTLLAGSFGRWPFDAYEIAVSRRRGNLCWICFLLSIYPGHVFARSQLITNLEWASFSTGWLILLWPRRYWVFGTGGVAPLPPQVWTPFIGPGRRAPDGSFRLTVDAPQSGVSVGDLIVVRGDDARIGLNRVFSPAESIRVFAVVGEGAAPPTVTLEILDSSGVVRESSPVRLHAAELVSANVLRRRPTIPIGQIDESVSLRGLPPGDYQIRVAAADDTRRSEKYADFTIAAPHHSPSTFSIRH